MLTAKKPKYKILPLWQYRIFVFRIRNTVLDHNQLEAKSLVVYETFYLSLFCLPWIIRLNSTSKTDLSLKLSNFEKNWVPTFSQHFFRNMTKFISQMKFFAARKSNGHVQRKYKMSINLNFHLVDKFCQWGQFHNETMFKQILLLLKIASTFWYHALYGLWINLLFFFSIEAVWLS